MSRFTRASAVCVIVLSALVSHRAWADDAPPDGSEQLVRVDGTELVVEDKPFRFVGANVSVMHGANERRDYEALLSAVASDGLSVVRVWALGEVESPGAPHHPLYAFRIGEQGWLEESFVHLDRVLAAAKARGLRVIVVLANRWKDYGGITTYLRWAGVPAALDAGGHVAGTALSTFYDCARCDELYRAHVERVVGRVNGVTGVRYRDDPTILAWELINEASAVTARDEDALVRWVEETARFVRSLDGHHLISAGHIGYDTERERAVWQRVSALPEIDFADAHAYPRSDPRVSSPTRLARWVEDRTSLARDVLHKPLVFGEVGFDGEGARHVHEERARWLGLFLERAARAGASGALVWHYDPAANPRRRHSISEAPADRGSRTVRAALSRATRAFSRGSSVSSKHSAQGTFARRFDFRSELVGRRAPHRHFIEQCDRWVLDMAPTSFQRASFERAGVFDQGALESAYGAGEGVFEYVFIPPKGVPEKVVLEARISSELPGQGLGDDARDGSDIEIEIDHELIGTVRAKPDDGLGEVVRVELAEARSLDKLFRAPGRHIVRLRALPSRYAGGLSIYGKATGVVALEDAQRRDVDAIRITWMKPASDATCADPRRN